MLRKVLTNHGRLSGGTNRGKHNLFFFCIGSHNSCLGNSTAKPQNILGNVFRIIFDKWNNGDLIKLLTETEKHIVHNINTNHMVNQSIKCNIFSENEAQRNQNGTVQEKHDFT